MEWKLIFLIVFLHEVQKTFSVLFLPMNTLHRSLALVGDLTEGSPTLGRKTGSLGLHGNEKNTHSLVS